MKLKKSLLLTGLILSSGSLLALPVGNKSAFEYITKMQTHSSSHVSIYLETDSANADACTLADRYVIDANASGYSALVATALSASVEANQIKITSLGCATYGDGPDTAPLVTMIKMALPAPPAPPAP